MHQKKYLRSDCNWFLPYGKPVWQTSDERNRKSGRKKASLLARLNFWCDQTDVIHAHAMRHVHNFGDRREVQIRIALDEHHLFGA